MEPTTSNLQSEIKRTNAGFELLARPNAVSETFQYDRLKVSPKVSPAVSEILAGVRITVVDDLADVLMKVGADLLAATQNKISLIFHTTQSSQELVDQIVTTTPDLLLIDGALRRGVKGADLLKSLAGKLPNTCMVAHSGDNELNQEMIRVGAFGFISKVEGDVQVDRIAAIFERYRQERDDEGLTPQDLSSAVLGESILDKNLEILCAFSLLLQSYLLTYASSSQRAEMGVPDGFLDESVLSGARESYKSPSWWMAPFIGINLEKDAFPAISACPSLKQFIKDLQTSPEVSLTWERADTINREIVAAIENARR